jgi:hypothetical protein
MLPAILAQIGLPILSQVIAAGLKKIDNPVAQSAAGALEQLQTVFAGGQISEEQLSEANRHTEAMAQLKMSENQTAMSEINASLRAEVASSDPYVRRMRPTFGYLMAITWAAQMMGLAYVVVFETEKAAVVLEATASLSTIWAVGLSVLGIYVYKRSEEKKITGSGFSLFSGSGAPPRKPTYNE